MFSSLTNLAVNFIGITMFRSYARVRVAYRNSQVEGAVSPKPDLETLNQGGDLPKIPGGTAIAPKVENALKSPKKP